MKPRDSRGNYFEYEEADFDWREKEKIRSEINTNYSKYRGKPIGIHLSYGLDDKSYKYYFKIMGLTILTFLFVANLEVIMMSELKKLLINVPDSYYDFVEGLLDEARKSEYRRTGLINFLKENPGALTSEVLKFLVDNLGLYDEYKQSEGSKRMAV